MRDELLSSLHNPRINELLRLRKGRERRRSGRALIDAGRELARALHGGVAVETVFVCESYLHSGEDPIHSEELAALEMARESGVEIQRVSERVFDKIAYGQRRSGLCARIRWRPLPLADFAPPPEPLLLVLENVEKPGNLGAIVRSADAAGADGVLLAETRVDLSNPNAIRASTGAIFHVPVVQGSAPQLRGWLESRGVPWAAALPDAPHVHWDTDLRGPLALVLGSEHRGLSATWTQGASRVLRIPMCGTADSLNVSVAAALLLYEARRQRGPVGPRSTEG
jgi:TrmH family RNA methyltransferase